MGDVRVSLVKIEGDMDRNNSMTAEIRDNTAEMVTLAKSMKLLGRIALWAGAFTGLAVAISSMMK